ncbi:hypothetical protein Dda_0825 [Drechslerella dactyloides]|uniref:Inheritance of peroxisomes protein 1 n=1 Tax=Drechslerella dactyloides TaxID=74499 RepID=A0AAD6J891_DREDA|nr:hypothetical protein Dda_0825 [Drechslerella dactyloides]
MASSRASMPAGGLKRAATVSGSNPSASRESYHPGTRKFSTGSLYTVGERSPVDPMAASGDDVEVLFHHPARIVSFKIPDHEYEMSSDEIAQYETPTERTLSSGFMKIYRVRFTTAFLQAGHLLQPLLPRSAGWCMDETRGIFVLRIRKDNYYRLELQELEGDAAKVEALKGVLDSIIIFEKTSCPFRPRAQMESFDHPAPLPVFRRSSSASAASSIIPRVTKLPFDTSGDTLGAVAAAAEPQEEEEEEDDEDLDIREIVETEDVDEDAAEIEDTPGPSLASIMSQKPFEEKPRASRMYSRQSVHQSVRQSVLQSVRQSVRQSIRQSMRPTSPGSMSPLSARSHSQDRFPQSTGPNYLLPPTEEDDFDPLLSGPSSPRLANQRIMSLNLPLSFPSSPNTSVDPRVTWAGTEEARGRSPEVKPLFVSPHPLSPIVIPERSFVPIDAYLDAPLGPTDSPHPSPLFSRTTTPVLYMSPDYESDSDASSSVGSLNEIVTPKTPNPYRGTVRFDDNFPSKPSVPPRVLIHDNDDGDSMNLNLRKSIMMRSNSMSLGRFGSYGDYEEFGYGFEAPARDRPSRRFIRSIDHEAAREVFGPAATNFSIHRPTGFLLRFMLCVAERIMKGVKTYLYYWGNWKKGWVRGKGEKEKEQPKEKTPEQKAEDRKSSLALVAARAKESAVAPPPRAKTAPERFLAEMEEFKETIAARLRKTLQRPRRGTM